MFDTFKNTETLKSLIGEVSWIDCQELFEGLVVVFRVARNGHFGNLSGFSVAVRDDGRVFDADRFGGRHSFPGLKRIVLEPLSREEILNAVSHYEAHSNTEIMDKLERAELEKYREADRLKEEAREKERERAEIDQERREYERLKGKFGK